MFKQDTVSNVTQFCAQNAVASRGKRGRTKISWRGWIVLMIGMLSVITVPGCRIGKLAVNEAILVSYRDMVWAKRAYNLRYGNCERPYGEHFYNGFCQGYSDVSNGADGYVPALPPSAYRSPRFQSADGAQCVNAWFEGYPAGVAAARQEKVGNYNNVLVSKMIDTAVTTEKNTKRVLPSDVPVTNNKTQQSSQRPAEISAPPVPDMTSSILIPSTTESADYIPAARLPGSDNRVSNRTTPAVKTPIPSLPPIVTGMGVVHEAKAQTNDFEAPMTNSAYHIR